MNLLDPWNVFYLVCFIAFYRIRGIFIARTKGETKVVRRMDGLEKALLAGMAPGTLVLPVMYLFTPWLAFADWDLPWLVKLPGAGLLVGSLVLFYKSHADLGQNWSVSLELREGHELVTQGVYRKVRHPMYSSIWLWAIGQGMVLENWLAGWSVAPAFALMYFIRTPREERLMLEKFGEKYREYMKRTGRIIPRVGRTEMDESVP
jgi:protein-S-isoprenylcysteine O-methyltransferase Ste14